MPRRARGAPCSLGRANGAMVVVVGLCQARLASRTERCVNDAPPTDGRGGVAMGVARGRPAVDAVRGSDYACLPQGEQEGEREKKRVPRLLKKENLWIKVMVVFFVFENFKNTATKCGKWPAPKAVRGSERARARH